MTIARTISAALFLLTAQPALAQPEDAASYPSRTVRLIVPSAPGGPIDAVARIMADAFRGAWPVPVVVENKPGAGTSTGGVFVAQSAPDGYTLLVNPNSIAVNPSLYPNLAYDPIKSFEPVSLLMTATQVLVVRPDLGVSNLKEFIELAKSKDGGLNIASAGGGTISHLTGVLLEQRANFKTTHVPFRGAAPALVRDARRPRRRHVGDAGARGAAPALRQAQGGGGDGCAARSRIAGGADRERIRRQRFSGRELAGAVRAGRHAEADRRQDRADRC